MEKEMLNIQCSMFKERPTIEGIRKKEEMFNAQFSSFYE
jgi:hypothetical protein